MLTPEGHHLKASCLCSITAITHPHVCLSLQQQVGGSASCLLWGIPACVPGPWGQHFGTCFGRVQPLPSYAASQAGSQGQKTLSSLAETPTQRGGRAQGEPLRMGT